MEIRLTQQALFRQEAITARASVAIGAIRLSTPLSHRLWALVGVSLAASVAVWLGVGQYTRRERVSGSLVPDAGLITASAHVLGTITAIEVNEGATVHAGDAIAAFSTERSSTLLGDTGTEISAQLHQQQARLQIDIDSAQQVADVRARNMRMQDAALGRQLNQVDGQIAIERRQVSELSALLSRFEGLGNNGYVSAIEVQQQRSQKALAEQQVQALTRQRVELLQQRETARNQLEELPLTTAATLNNLHRQWAQVNQSLAQNEADRASVLRAPADGVVSAVLVKRGQAVAPGQAVVSLVPLGSALEAQLWVPSQAIGFVRIGTSVVLRYNAFPYQKFGAQRGTVTAVSRSALTPTELTAVLGQTSAREALYRVDVALPEQYINVYGHPEPLKPGMAVEADLLLDKRRMIEWIFEPLYGLGRRNATGRS
ncbi:HlyD family secretion protein [Dyella kyungheensis]|jgi:membrane fusion protein|uniref:HlyD family secretion protein n=1 Tax=Dyella kyungheensis TaxID=1242174 RepID=UPI003CED2D8D